MIEAKNERNTRVFKGLYEGSEHLPEIIEDSVLSFGLNGSNPKDKAVFSSSARGKH